MLNIFQKFSTNFHFCLACEAEARHMYCFSSGVVVVFVVGVGCVNFLCLGHFHTRHKLWTDTCEIRQNFKWDLIKFCETFTKIAFKLPKGILKSSFSFNKLLTDTIKWDLCLLCHKISDKFIYKFCEIWKFFWELAFRWAKFCEVLSHSVRYGMYAFSRKL